MKSNFSYDVVINGDVVYRCFFKPEAFRAYALMVRLFPDSVVSVNKQLVVKEFN